MPPIEYFIQKLYLSALVFVVLFSIQIQYAYCRVRGNHAASYLGTPEPQNKNCYSKLGRYDSAAKRGSRVYDGAGWLFPIDVMCPASEKGFLDCCDCMWKDPLLEMQQAVSDAWDEHQATLSATKDKVVKHTYRYQRKPIPDRFLPHKPADIDRANYDLPMEVDAARARRSGKSYRGWQSVEFRCVITLPDEDYIGYFVNDRNFRRARFTLPKITRRYQTWCRPDETYTEIVTETKRQYPVYYKDGQLVTHAISGACIPHNTEHRQQKRVRYPLELELDVPNIKRHLVKLGLQLPAVSNMKNACGDIELPRWDGHGQRSTRPAAKLKVNLISQLSEPSMSYTFGIAEGSKSSDSQLQIMPGFRGADLEPTEFGTFLDETLAASDTAAVESAALQYNSLFDSMPEESDWIEAETSHLVNFMSLVSEPPPEGGVRRSYVVQKRIGPIAQLELNIHGKRTRADDNAEVFDNLDPRPRSSLSWDNVALQDGSRLRACVGMQPAFPASSSSLFQDLSLAIEFESFP